MLTSPEVGDLIHIEEVGGIVNDDGQANVDRFEVPADLLLIYSQTRNVFLDMSSLTGEKDSVQRKVRTTKFCMWRLTINS